MKNFFLITAFVLLTATLFAQDKILRVEYQAFHNVDRPFTENDTLYIDASQNRSLYKENNPWIKAGAGSKIDSVTPRAENQRAINMSLIAKLQGYNYFDFNRDSLFSLTDIYGENYLVAEKIPEIKWQLTDEHKMIDKYKILKATCNFRGRNYTAWYSPDYPIKYGPWKFSGLPGLIFEVQDETNRYHWQIKNIVAYTDSTGKVFEKRRDVAGIPILSLKEYAAKMDDTKAHDEDVNAKLMAILPRGNMINLSSPKKQRYGKELKFEWEE